MNLTGVEIMVKIDSEIQYQGALKRVEELMLSLPEDTPADDPRMVELQLLGNLVADYDEEHFPLEKLDILEPALANSNSIMILKNRIRCSVDEVRTHLQGRKELPNARDINF